MFVQTCIYTDIYLYMYIYMCIYTWRERVNSVYVFLASLHFADTFGVSIRYTVFELTFSGGWIVRVRPVVDNVSHWYAIPFLCYITSRGLQFKVSRFVRRHVKAMWCLQGFWRCSCQWGLQHVGPAELRLRSQWRSTQRTLNFTFPVGGFCLRWRSSRAWGWGFLRGSCFLISRVIGGVSVVLTLFTRLLTLLLSTQTSK